MTSSVSVQSRGGDHGWVLLPVLYLLTEHDKYGWVEDRGYQWLGEKGHALGEPLYVWVPRSEWDAQMGATV